MKIKLTLFAKSDGPLTKRISLGADGKLISDGSCCLMWSGVARQVEIAGIGKFGKLIEQIKVNEAIALGTMRPGLQSPVTVITKRKLNGQANTIARTAADISYRKGEVALALLDFDTKGMPPEVKAKLRAYGGYWQALVAILPELEDVARLTRRSTSAGLSRADTGAVLPGSDGLHIYLAVKDGTDNERFLKTLHLRCWLAGLGWMMVSASGQLLERSIVDRMVGAAERLVFEGGPVLEPPLKQDRDSRRPIVVEGDTLDTVAACPPLSITEQSELDTLRAKWRSRLADEAAKARRAFIARQAQALATSKGLELAEAEKVIIRQCEGVLLSDLVLPFDEPELAGMTVADVLADPERFVGATLADPHEGVADGTCKAQIMRRADGSLWIHSFAHGRTIYELKHDAAAIRKAITAAAKEEAVEVFVSMAVDADLDAVETEELRNQAAKIAGINKRTVSTVLKAAVQKRASERKRAEQERRLATRTDPRPQASCPLLDAPWLPEMEVLTDVINGGYAWPDARALEGDCTKHRRADADTMRAFNKEEEQ